MENRQGRIEMSKRYIQRAVGQAEIGSLATIAESEEADFFGRNPHLVELYRSRLVAVALCQGAALQYLGRGYGVNDFDLHFFYRQNPDKLRLSRAVRRIFTAVGSFEDAPVDFVRTVIPWQLCDEFHNPGELVRAFLQRAWTSNAQHLAEKAVIGLLPEELFGVVLWPV
jgi:hypothetical protein